MKQFTLKEAFTVCGKGLHTGLEILYTVRTWIHCDCLYCTVLFYVTSLYQRVITIKHYEKNTFNK